VSSDAAIPGTWEWSLYNSRRHESRSYVQSELALDGEARLVGIATKVGAVLTEGGYTWGDLYDLTDENRQIDWAELSKMVSHLVQFAPDLISETAGVFLSVYPTDEDGVPDPTYSDQVKFIRGALNVARFVDMVRVFMQQNDYARVLAPFSRTLSETMAAIAGDPQGSPSTPSPDPSSEVSVMGSDGSTILVEPASPTPEVSESGTATSSGPSPT